MKRARVVIRLGSPDNLLGSVVGSEALEWGESPTPPDTVTVHTHPGSPDTDCIAEKCLTIHLEDA